MQFLKTIISKALSREFFFSVNAWLLIALNIFVIRDVPLINNTVIFCFTILFVGLGIKGGEK